jgi:hypothetical protein
MKMLMTVTLFLMSSIALADYVNLSPGQSVVINGTHVSCGSNVPDPGPNHNVLCNRLKAMPQADVYNMGYFQGYRNCSIINNNGYYGVLHAVRGQISPTYTSAHDNLSEYSSSSMTVATGFVQLVCNGSCN